MFVPLGKDFAGMCPMRVAVLTAFHPLAVPATAAILQLPKLALTSYQPLRPKLCRLYSDSRSTSTLDVALGAAMTVLTKKCGEDFKAAFVGKTVKIIGK
jgi:hypothetical protein